MSLARPKAKNEMLSPFQITCTSRIIFLVVCALTVCSSGSAEDQWSKGSAGESWDRINRLQSMGRRAHTRSNFVVTCTQSENAVERAAAVSWIARTGSFAHVEDLKALLNDPSPTVRRLAWLALLNLPDVNAAKIVLWAIETKEMLPPVDEDQYGGIGAEIDDLVRICQESFVERNNWIAGIANRDEWIDRHLKDFTNSTSVQIELKCSIVDATEHFLFSVTPDTNVIFQAFLSEPIEVESAAQRAWSDLSPNARVVVQDLELLHVEPMDNENATEEFPPGVYAVSFQPTGKFEPTPLERFPFYVRIQRSSIQEQEIQELLEKPLNSQAVKRLGRLRAQAAVPSLIEHFVSSTGCEQFLTGKSLALIGDARATKAFLNVHRLSCDDTSSSSHSLLQMLDPNAKRICSEAILEMGTALLDNWESTLSTDNRWREIFRVAQAFYNCERPLRAEQIGIGAELASRLVEQGRSLVGDERQVHLYLTSEYLVAYLGGDSTLIVEWVRANREDPELILAFLREFLWSSRMEATGFEYSRQCLQELEKEILQWRTSASLNEDQKNRLDKEISHLQSKRSPR